MGILDDMAGTDPGDAAAPEPDDPETGASGEPAASAEPAEPKTERVALPSRRQAAAEKRNAIEQQIQALNKTIAERDAQFQEQLSRRDAEIARVRGGFEALQQFQRQPAAPVPPPADSATLRKQARKALDDGDFDAYQDMTERAILAQAEQRWKATQQTAAPAAAPIPLPVQAVINSFPDVIEHPNGMQLAIAEDMKLNALGVADGPARYRKAFELARTQIGKPTPPAFSRQSRGVLAGVPPARNTPSGDEAGPGVVLTEYELNVAKRCGMSPKEYAAYVAEMSPSRVQAG